MRIIISPSLARDTFRILRRELARIETETGYRPEDWLSDVYDESINDYMDDNGFDFDAFEMHLSCKADEFIDFINEHYQHWRMTI